MPHPTEPVAPGPSVDDLLATVRAVRDQMGAGDDVAALGARAAALNPGWGGGGAAGRPAAAVAAAEEAVALGRRAIETRPDDARFVLISALINRAGGRLRVGDIAAAVEGLEEAARLFQGAGPSGLPFLGSMVEALHQAALAFAELALWPHAVTMRRLIVDLFGESVPQPAVQMLVLTLVQGARVAAQAEDAPLFPGLAWAEEAVGLARMLARPAAPDEPPPGDSPSLLLAQAWGGRAVWRHGAGDSPGGLQHALEAVDLLHGVVGHDPVAAVPTLILTLESLAGILRALGLDDQAATVEGQQQVLRASLDRLSAAAPTA